MITTNDKWFRLLAILLPAVVIFFAAGIMEMPITSVKLFKFLVSVTSIILISEGSRFIIYKSRTWGFVGAIKRNLAVILLGVSYTMIILAFSKVTREYISTGILDFGIKMNAQVSVNGKQVSVGLFGYSLLNAIINFIFLFILYDILYHYAKLRHTEKMKDLLEKEKLKAELQQLKGIVNPHFLFNNLNSLSSLIVEDPKQAEIFLDELTKVFRYLLKNNDTELTTLGNELHFIQSYYHLLQTRYGRSIQLDLRVEKEDEALFIPPLTLQLLVENAVKHNSLQKENPLQIVLFSAPGKRLVLRNNIAKKDNVVESTGIGLQNINARYRMLKNDGLVIEKTEKDFAVIIPLIY